MAEEMLEYDGISKITQIDWSYTAINLLEKANQERGNTVITTKQMDARRLDFANNTFDVVIDKGLLDALTCGDGAHANINMMLEEAHRVLKPQGVFFCLSRAVESKRKDKYMKKPEKFNWRVKTQMIQKPGIGAVMKAITQVKKSDKKNFHFLYICKK